MTAMSVSDLKGMLAAITANAREESPESSLSDEANALYDKIVDMESEFGQADFYFLEVNTDDDIWMIVS